MNLYPSMVLQPSSLVILLAYGALLALVSLTPFWFVMVTHIEEQVNSNSENVLSQFQSEIENSARLIQPMNSSSISLARFLSSSLKVTNISFSEIETKLAPLLFEAFETVPFLTQISYIGMEGLFFSYYSTGNDQVLALYSNTPNSTTPWGASNANVHYIQHVNRDTGVLYGEAMVSKPNINVSWFAEAVNSSKGYASLGTQWNNDHDLLFISSARVTSAGVICLGFSAAAIADFFTRVGYQGTSLYLATKDGQMLVEGIQHTRMVVFDDHSVKAIIGDDQTGYQGTVSCKDTDIASVLNIQGTKYLMRCSTIDILGIESVYVLAMPQNGLVGFVHGSKKQGLKLLIMMMVMAMVSMVSFMFTNARSCRQEKHLCGSLVKQMEATQQAEQKSMNKSVAFANASHDIRASLAGLSGLLEISYHHVAPGSELETNLKQMDSCTKDLLGLLNSILDTSKIEAGKMQLEEEEFDVFQLLEDVVDLYHPVAMKKGVDIILDTYNGSLLNYSCTKGDRGKLKQILCNLVSNSVKFTEEGYIIVRAWAQKPSLQNSLMVTNTNSFKFKRLFSRMFYRENEAHDDDDDDVEAANLILQDQSSMDFTFEVDDSGKGIPKEMYKSVFENYVQVKDTALRHGGTGLGLGIVRSLVRLMHGDIKIMEKVFGENGTCFRFNVLLSVCETDKTNEEGHFGSIQAQGNTICTVSSAVSMNNITTRLPTRTHTPVLEASQVILLIQNEERRKTTERFMKNLGIKVKVVKEWTDLSGTLNHIKEQFSEIVEASSSPIGFVLMIIEASAGPFYDIFRMVSDFRRGLCHGCKVVWLEKPLMQSIDFNILDEDVSSSNDIVLSKPFHGTRMFQVIRILPEYGDVCLLDSSSRAWKGKGKVFSSDNDGGVQSVVHWQKGASSSGTKETDQQCYDATEEGKSIVQQGEIQVCGKSSNKKDFSKVALEGMKILIVEDSPLLRRIAKATLEKLGASVMECVNGEQVVHLVDEVLNKDSCNTPYDFILMDCQMPVMDGYEATRKIREIEKPYGVHVPIFALTGNTGEEAKMSTEAGMDHHLVKPINKEALLEAIYIHAKE